MLTVKPLLAYVLIMLMSTPLFSNALLADEYDEALKKARTEGKPFIIFFYIRSCPYCDTMDRESLSNREIRNIMKTSVVLLKIDAEKQKNITRLYSVRVYPTTWLLEPTGRRVAMLPGYIPREDFKDVVDYLKGEHYKNMGLREYLSKTRAR
jgi:thioredoxin-related protein